MGNFVSDHGLRLYRTFGTLEQHRAPRGLLILLPPTMRCT